MEDNKLIINPNTAALVVIDLQHGITGREVAPHSSKEVLANAVKLADKFRALNALVVLVRVTTAGDGKDMLRLPVDQPMTGMGERPANFDVILEELGPKPADIIITKHQWGAFYGTELDLQLRRRGIDTVVLGGISTNHGVESTARDAYERNYKLVLVEDMMAGMDGDAHNFAISKIFPRLGRIRKTEDVLQALGS